jgi:hypothetical protein
MVTKKGAKSKIVKKTASSQETISAEEQSLIEESFNLIKNLNTQVTHVEKAKNKLEGDVAKLAKKVTSHDSEKHYNTLFSSIKEEIVKEFAPLLKKLDMKGVKIDVFDEISKLVDLEINKIRAEFDVHSKKSKKDIQKVLSDLELRIVDSLNQNSKIKSELKDFDGKSIMKLISNLEKKLENSLSKIQLKYDSNISTSIKEVNALKIKLEKQSKGFTKSLKDFDVIKKEVISKVTEEEIDFSVFDSKVISLQKEMSSIKSLVGRFENDLYSDSAQKNVTVLKKKVTLLQKSFGELQQFTATQVESLATQLESMSYIEESVNESLKETSKKQDKISKSVLRLSEDFKQLKKVAKEEVNNDSKKVNLAIKKSTEILHEFDVLKESYDKILSDKLVEFSNHGNQFEQRVQKLEKLNEKEMRREFLSILKNETKQFEDNIHAEMRNDVFKIKEIIDEKLEHAHNDALKFKEELSNFKSDSQTLFKNYLNELHSEFESLRHISATQDTKQAEFAQSFEVKLEQIELAQEGVQKYISSKYNEIVDAFENLSLLSEKELRVQKDELSNESKALIEDVKKEVKENFASEILKLQEFTTHSSTSLKEYKRDLSEGIESKFLVSQESFERDFKEYMSSFEGELKQKESNFATKLIAIEDEKNNMLVELHEFKHEIANLTKEYSGSLDKELDKLKAEDTAFEDKKKEFLAHVDDVLHVRRVQLEEDFELYKGKLSGFTQDIRHYFTEQDNSFRTSFGEKTSQLHDYLEKSIQRLDKKFVERNISNIKLGLQDDFTKLHLIGEQLESKQSEIIKKQEFGEQKELDFFENLHSEHTILQEKTETRVMGLEKQFNKRFLDFDSQFSNFKSIVVDEVEDLMKEVHTLVKTKFDSLDNYETKLKVLVSEGERKMHELHDVQGIVDREVRDIRDEISDIRVKMDVMDPEFDVNSLSSLVSTMSEYEKHLGGLVETLRGKGVSDKQILDVLASKGHPRVYAKMILDDFKAPKQRNKQSQQ